MRPCRCLALFSLVALTAACGTLPNGRAWGEDATATPGWRQVRAAWTVIQPMTARARGSRVSDSSMRARASASFSST